MSQASLRTVTLKTVANTRRAAERAVGAYRTGGHRLVAAVHRSVDTAATRGTERYVPRLGDLLRRATGNVSGIADKGIDVVSDGTERAIAVSTDTVTAQVKRVAELAEGIDNRLVASSLDAAARLTMPGAQAALTLSEKLVDGATKLSGMAAGKPAKRVRSGAKRSAAKPARKPAPVVKAVKVVEDVVDAVVVEPPKPVKKAAAKPAAKPASRSRRAAPAAPAVEAAAPAA